MKGTFVLTVVYVTDTTAKELSMLTTAYPQSRPSIKQTLLRLEGCFRLMSPATERSDSAILREIVKMLGEYNGVAEFLLICEDTVVMADTAANRRKGRVDNEADGAVGWPEMIAYMLARVLAPLQKDLLEERF